MNSSACLFVGLIAFNIILVMVARKLDRKAALGGNSFRPDRPQGGPLLLWLLLAAAVLLYISGFGSIEVGEEQATLVAVTGAVVWLLSLGLWSWARLTLAANFHHAVGVYEKHKLVQIGPFKYIRHPIYLSYLGMSIGATVVSLNLVIAGVSLLSTSLMISRIPREERVLEKKFGTEFRAYKRTTGRIWPRIGGDRNGT